LAQAKIETASRGDIVRAIQAGSRGPSPRSGR